MAAEPPADSLYHLQADLATQSGRQAPFGLYRGHPVLVSMFYGSCPATCPMLITSMQVYESHLDEASRGRLRALLLVSFDAAHDTPAQLARLARLHRVDPPRWTFANASQSDARRIAALFGISYRPLPEGGFDHSLLITLLDDEGRVTGQHFEAGRGCGISSSIASRDACRSTSHSCLRP
jgi:protein SCO1/2